MTDRPELTTEQKADLRAIFEGKIEGKSACRHCGGIHLRACPRVRRIEWHADGTIVSAEYWSPGEWETDWVMWPESAYEDDPPPS